MNQSEALAALRAREGLHGDLPEPVVTALGVLRSDIFTNVADFLELCARKEMAREWLVANLTSFDIGHITTNHKVFVAYAHLVEGKAEQFIRDDYTTALIAALDAAEKANG